MSNKPEFVIKPAHFVIGLLVFVLLAVGCYAAWPTISAAAKAPGVEESAARAGAEAFLNRDYRLGHEAWIQAVCTVSTENGCQLMTKAIAPAAWPAIEQARQVATCQIMAAERYLGLKATRDGAAIESQVWKLNGRCVINGAEARAGDVLVAIVKEEDTWKFDHLVSAQELKELEASK